MKLIHLHVWAYQKVTQDQGGKSDDRGFTSTKLAFTCGAINGKYIQACGLGICCKDP